MKLPIVALLVLCLTSADALAQAKPRGCFTKAEESAEQLVRGGLRLREGALGCDGPPWEAGTRPLWEQIDRQFGSRFARQTQIRQRAFEREFAKDAENRLQVWDGRIVFHYRHYPLSATYCANLKDMMEKMLRVGWAVFARQAATARDEVKMDYKPCP
jgi:hypothetical protein